MMPNGRHLSTVGGGGGRLSSPKSSGGIPTRFCFFLLKALPCLGLLLFVFMGNSCYNLDSDRIVQSLSLTPMATQEVKGSGGGDGNALPLPPQRREEAPYGEFCETRPRGEKQLWNTRKKVIAFSLFVPQLTDPPTKIPSYFFDGLAANLRQQQLYFPDWITRIYTLNLSDEQIQQVLDMDDTTSHYDGGRVEVVKCHQDSSLNQLDNARKMITRFLVVDDPTVEYSISRDLDSRPSIRELLAVNEWMSSGLKFHTIRDHRYHIVPVMGGMFGMKRGLFDIHNTTMTDIVKKAVSENPKKAISGCCKDDQNFLARYIWGLVKTDAMDHDMDGGRRCKMNGSKVCRKFPIGGPWEESAFVGLPFNYAVKGVSRNTHFECTMSCSGDHNTEYKDVLTSNQGNDLKQKNKHTRKIRS